MLALHIAYLVVLSASSLLIVHRILRAADRRCFPSTFVPLRAPEVLVAFDDYSPLDWKGLV